MSEAVFEDESVLAGWRKLMFAMEHPITATQGVSSEAVRRMTAAVQFLETLEDPVHHSGARRTLRFVAALVPLTVSDGKVASIVCEVASHPALPMPEVRAILRGDSPGGGIQGETPAPKLRAVAQRLREGESREEIAAAEGVALNLVRQLSEFMGRADARHELLQERALDWTGTMDEFARVNGIGQKYASRLIKAAWGR